MMKDGMLLCALWSMPLLNMPPIMDKLFSKRPKPQLVFCRTVATVAMQLVGQNISRNSIHHTLYLKSKCKAPSESSSAWKKHLQNITYRIYQTAKTAAILPIRAKGTADGNNVAPNKERKTRHTSFILMVTNQI